MFNSKEQALEKLVQKGNWEKIRKNYINADKQVQLNLAKACLNSKSDDSVNVLISLLEVGDEQVKIEALKSIAIVGTDHAVALIQHTLTNTPPDQAALRTQLQDTLVILRGKK